LDTSLGKKISLTYLIFHDYTDLQQCEAYFWLRKKMKTKIAILRPSLCWCFSIWITMRTSFAFIPTHNDVPKRGTMTPQHIPWEKDISMRSCITKRIFSEKENILKCRSYDASKDYLITDSVDIPKNLRPSAFSSISNPRDILALPLLFAGIALSYCNILGSYDTTYENITKASIGLGAMNAMASFVQVAIGYNVNTGIESIRRGITDDPTVTLYAGLYSAAVTWQALRTCSFCPQWLSDNDVVLAWLAFAIYIYSLAAPVSTLLGSKTAAWLTSWRWLLENDTLKDGDNNHHETPEMTETELLRARGLLATGILACVFAFDAFAFGCKGQDWWSTVISLHPSQTTLESSTALFALYAVESNMVAHRFGKAGVYPWTFIVPSACIFNLFVAIVPCLAALYWLGNDISFFSFYSD